MSGTFPDFPDFKHRRCGHSCWRACCSRVHIPRDACECGVAEWSLTPASPENITLPSSGASLPLPSAHLWSCWTASSAGLDIIRFGTFAHLWGVKWYTVLFPAFTLPFPHGGEADYPLWLICWPCRLLLLLTVCSQGTSFLYWWWDLAAEKQIDHSLYRDTRWSLGFLWLCCLFIFLM